ncbi:sigma-70 family RNA polymerase sigma factor [Neobacillus muris]|uniref:sigma-70 family RNA polymerase sigma factor n=1 Tax=Neobacillus muris TaxID=2941334 RepID=UPI00203C2625|nr:sigma-70 family RNA polymerase sigma factor [Neobacillus muris]
MIPAKMDPVSITAIREKGAGSILDWFEQHSQAFYTLGWTYLRTQQQMEELFYLSIIKVQKELPRFKNETSFETWVTSIFIHICREFSHDKNLQVSKESELRQDLFIALDQLKESEKEAVVLTYINGIPMDQTAHLLQVSVQKVKELLFSGIQSLRKEMGYGSAFYGCKEYHGDYIDYLERTLERSRKIDLEKHIYQCQNCQEDLAAFQDVMLELTERMEDLPMPSGFMENVKNRLAETDRRRKEKNQKRKRKALVIAGMFALLMGIGYFTGMFSSLYYTWTEENLELRAFLKQDLGERLNLEAKSDGVKIKIKGVVADEVQTLVFYEIEDTNKDNQYVINYDDGVFVENSYEIMNRSANPRYNPLDLESEVNKEAKNVYQGKISLLPLSKDNGTIKLNISRLMKLNPNSYDENGFRMNDEMDYATGDWNFEIPVTRQPSIEYALNEETEIEGIPVRFDKLTIAPTAAILQYSIRNEQSKKQMFLNFDSLEVNDKKVKADIYGSSFVETNQDMDWSTFQTPFEALAGEKPKEVKVHFGAINLNIEDHKSIELDASREYPQTFDYAGSTITIEKVEVGQPTKVVLSNHDIKNRAYESLQFNIIGEDETVPTSMDMSPEGVLVDKNGKEYDLNRGNFAYEEIEQPRYFTTVDNIELHSDNVGEEVNPKRLEIYGYNTTKYLADVVKISLE